MRDIHQKSSASPIGVGIIGVNPRRGWAATAHIPAIRALPQYSLNAVCTSNPESAKQAADAFGVEGYSDIREMVERPDISLVVITVRAPKHHDALSPIIESGKAVLCEWPLGKNLAEIREMTRAVDATGIANFVGLQAQQFTDHKIYTNTDFRKLCRRRAFHNNCRLWKLMGSCRRPGRQVHS